MQRAHLILAILAVATCCGSLLLHGAPAADVELAHPPIARSTKPSAYPELSCRLCHTPPIVTAPLRSLSKRDSRGKTGTLAKRGQFPKVSPTL